MSSPLRPSGKHSTRSALTSANWRGCESALPAAKAAGRNKGRAPTARAKTGEIHKLAAEGVGKAEIARRLGIGERSVYRMLSAQQPD